MKYDDFVEGFFNFIVKTDLNYEVGMVLLLFIYLLSYFGFLLVEDEFGPLFFISKIYSAGER